MTLGFFVDIDGVIAWSSSSLDKALASDATASGGLPEPLLRATWDFLANRELDENCYEFCRDFGRHTLGGYRNDPGWDLSWMLSECSPSQACFRYWILGVKPELWSAELEARTTMVLSRFPFAF